MVMDWGTTSALAAAIAALLPGSVGFVLSRGAGFSAGKARVATAMGAGAALLFALLACAAYAASPDIGLWRIPVELPGGFELGLGARVDGLTCLMLMTVSLVGAVVARFSIRYLDGDPGQARFCQWVAYTLSAVLVVIVANDLSLLLAGWLASSHGLHHLLEHWADRPAAVRAARKKFLISRIGDVLLVSAFALIAIRFGTLEIGRVFAGIDAASESALWPIVLLLALGAMTKSAQFPFHTWLPDSLETPTAVSALLHAGIINAGGFLLIRMSPLLSEAPMALLPLAAGGALTALLGSVSMLAQTDVKRKLAYSTVAQMGFMMLQLGLGAFAAATLHMVGHAFYKAHAFLASGTAVEPAPPGAWPREATRPSHPIELAAAIAIGAAIVVGSALAWGVAPEAKAGLPVLGTVLALAIAQILLLPVPGGSPLRHRAALASIGAAMAAAYFGGVALVERILGGALPSSVAPITAIGTASAVIWIALFAVAFVVQQRLAGSNGAWARALWVHAYNGFYLGTIQNRIVDRIWPVAPVRDRSPRHSPRGNPLHLEGALR
jgi:NAD(P)H-quinone oxidoreductase subunit 5